jgi:deoxyribodipyrimidine photolyase-related protein
MRKRENILLDIDGKPEGGKWNYDAENRKFDRKHEKSWNFSLQKNEYVQEAEEYYALTPSLSPNGRGEFPNYIPTNRPEALKLLEYFLKNHLHDF